MTPDREGRRSPLRFKEEDTVTSGQSVPKSAKSKLRQKAGQPAPTDRLRQDADPASGVTVAVSSGEDARPVVSGQNVPKSKFRQESEQSRPSDRLRQEGESRPRQPADPKKAAKPTKEKLAAYQDADGAKAEKSNAPQDVAEAILPVEPDAEAEPVSPQTEPQDAADADEPEAPRPDDPLRQTTSGNGDPTKSPDFVGRGGARERTEFSPQGGNEVERTLRRRVPKQPHHGNSDRDFQEDRQSAPRQEPKAENVHQGPRAENTHQGPKSENVHQERGHADRASGGDDAEAPKVRKARERMEKRGGKVEAAQQKLAKQKPLKKPGPVKQAAGFAGWKVHGFIHGKVYEVEHENVGTEGAHHAELVAEAAGRKTVSFTKDRIRTHPARAAQKAQDKCIKATADYHFQQTVLEHPEMQKDGISKMWSKHQQRKRYKKEAQEAAKTGAKAAEATATATENAGRAIVNFVKEHPAGVGIALCILLLLIVMQSCTASLAAVGNGVSGSVAATTYPAVDADLTGAEAAYCEMEADLQSYLNTYTSTHSYDEYHFDLDAIEHDPYVLLSILSALHPEGWTLADVGGDLQSVFDRQYILTENVTVEQRYYIETDTWTDADGNSHSSSYRVYYDYYICTVSLENTNLSHVPVYMMNEGQLSRYSLFMATLGNRPDLFPTSAYVGRYSGNYTTHDVPREYLDDETFAAILTEAEKYLGFPYVWGGSSPATSFDCSGFVSWVINHSGWNVGRLGAQGLYNICTRTNNPRPGDLVFFRYTYNAPDPDGVTHVGIYVGDGWMIHCGDPIQYADLSGSYWQSHFYAYGRLP